MKTSLHKHSFRTVGLALGLAVSLAAARHSAQAAIVQITLGADYTRSFISNQFNDIYVDITKDGIADKVKSFSAANSSLTWKSYDQSNTPIATLAEISTVLIAPGGLVSFIDGRINNGAETTGFAQATYFWSGRANDDSSTVTLTRVMFDDASPTLPQNFTPSSSNYSEFSATSVPEPGTFIPAAVLVMGAILRRRRSRSHRSGRATA